MINACAKCQPRRGFAAQKVFKQMLRSGVQPNKAGQVQGITVSSWFHVVPKLQLSHDCHDISSFLYVFSWFTNVHNAPSQLGRSGMWIVDFAAQSDSNKVLAVGICKMLFLWEIRRKTSLERERESQITHNKFTIIQRWSILICLLNIFTSI